MCMTEARSVRERYTGNTRLIDEFAVRKRAEGHLAVVVGPDPSWCEVAYHALREAVIGLTVLTPEDIELEQVPKANPDARKGLLEILRGGARTDDRRSPMERRFGL